MTGGNGDPVACSGVGRQSLTAAPDRHVPTPRDPSRITHDQHILPAQRVPRDDPVLQRGTRR
jgi:hypothetical protein